jgi:hypothetical protein
MYSSHRHSPFISDAQPRRSGMRSYSCHT